MLDDFLAVEVGDEVKRTGEVLSLAVGEELIGRVIDPLGVPLDGKGPVFTKTKPHFSPLEARAPSVLERESVNTPLHTGIKAIDAIIPIGRGQRELIIGDRQVGKTAVALDAILNQAKDIGQADADLHLCRDRAKRIEGGENSGNAEKIRRVRIQHHCFSVGVDARRDVVSCAVRRLRDRGIFPRQRTGCAYRL